MYLWQGRLCCLDRYIDEDCLEISISIVHTDERGMAKMCLDWALYSVVMTIYEIEKEYFLDSLHIEEY